MSRKIKNECTQQQQEENIIVRTDHINLSRVLKKKQPFLSSLTEKRKKKKHRDYKFIIINL